MQDTKTRLDNKLFIANDKIAWNKKAPFKSL